MQIIQILFIILQTFNDVSIHPYIHACTCRIMGGIYIPAAAHHPHPHPEHVICCLSTVDWESPSNADLLLAGLMCGCKAALYHSSNPSKPGTIRQPATHSIPSLVYLKQKDLQPIPQVHSSNLTHLQDVLYFT